MGGGSSVQFRLGTANHFFEAVISAPFLCAGTFTQVAILRPDYEMYTNLTNPIDYLRLSNGGSPNDFYKGSVDRMSTEPSYLPKSTISFGNNQFLGSTLGPVSSSPMIVIYTQTAGGFNLTLNGSPLDAWTNYTSYSQDLSCNLFSMQVGIGGLVPSGVPFPAMEISEIMLYDWSIGQAEKEQLGCYAKKKYGVTNYTGPCN